MPNRLQRTLEELREALSEKAEQAYRERDAAQKAMDTQAADYADGAGLAYSIAEGVIRDAQKAADEELAVGDRMRARSSRPVRHDPGRARPRSRLRAPRRR